MLQNLSCRLQDQPSWSSISLALCPARDFIIPLSCTEIINYCKTLFLIHIVLIMVRDTLHMNESLGRGDTLVSPDGRKKLIFQDDGHICLYLSELFVWGTGTNGTSAQRMTMQADGNLCVYDNQNHCIWESRTNHHDGENLRLQLQDDGNLCIYGNVFLWGTMTHDMRRFRKIRFLNSGRTSFDSYPLVKDARTGETVWNGRDNSGPYWCIRNGKSIHRSMP